VTTSSMRQTLLDEARDIIAAYGDPTAPIDHPLAELAYDGRLDAIATQVAGAPELADWRRQMLERRTTQEPAVGAWLTARIEFIGLLEMVYRLDRFKAGELLPDDIGDFNNRTGAGWLAAQDRAEEDVEESLRAILAARPAALAVAV
jgi:hypothetical protein